MNSGYQVEKENITGSEFLTYVRTLWAFYYGKENKKHQRSVHEEAANGQSQVHGQIEAGGVCSPWLVLLCRSLVSFKFGQVVIERGIQHHGQATKENVGI